ncbi:MAG: hypothetical protein LWX83_10125 [Anaerolineae bacterium]|nr:hypothetical protein [Anaerolineae bacterium]
MLWKILRARLWLLRRSLWGKDIRQRITNIVIFLVILGGAGSVFVLLVNALNGLTSPKMIFAMLPSAIYTLVFFMIIKLADTLYQRYLSPDLFWLNQAPLSRRDIYLAKVVECSLALWLPALFFYALIVALGLTLSLSPLFFISSILLILSLVFWVTIAGMIIIMFLAQIIPARRIREMLPLAIAAFSIGAILLQRTHLTTNKLSTFDFSSMPFQDSFVEFYGVTLLAVVVTLCFCWLGYLLYKVSNDKAINAIQMVSMPINTPKTGSQPGLSEILVYLSMFFPSDQINIIRKDWTILRRDLQRATNLVLTPLMMGVIMIPMMGSDDMYVAGYWIMLLYAALFGMNSSQSLAIPTFSLEARSFSFIFRSPVKMKSVMWAKFWSAWIPTALVWVIVLSIGSVLVHLNLWQWLVLVVMNIVCVAGSCFVGVAASARSADFSAVSPRPKLNGPTVWLALLYSFIWNLSILLFTCCLIFVLSPNAIAVKTFLESIPFTIPSFIFWIGAIGGLIVCGLISIPMILLWLSGLHRLEKWQQV